MLLKRRGKLLGFCITHIERAGGTGAGYVVTLDVAPAARRKGLARRLMHAAEQQAVAAGCRLLALHVFSGNTAAIAFYEYLGFTRSHCERGFYGKGLDALVYLKELAM